MIPTKLKLSNFTSYGEKPQELDFTRFKLAAISGFNGAGKSSLLDAITWCIWGSSRAGDSSDSLVRLGQNQMYVEFSFDLDGHQYSIKRSRSKKSGGHTNLEFWSNSHNLTEGTIKSTQQKIINSLHLTFETFTNSSFLRQGHADEFTIAGPADRKRILADILGLDHYEQLEQKAKEKVKDSQNELQKLSFQLSEIEVELSQKDERQSSYSKTQEEIKSAKQKQKEIEILIKRVEEEKQTLQINLNSLLEQKERFEKLNLEINDLKVQIELKEKAREEFKVILDKKELIEKSFSALQNLLEQKKLLDTKRGELIKIKDELVLIQKQINEREDKRKKTIADLEVQIKEFETKNETFLKQNEQLEKSKSVCPTCKQPINESLNKQIVKNNNILISENNINLEELKSKCKKYESVVLPEYEHAKLKDVQIKKLERETEEYQEITQKISVLEKFSDAYLKLQQAEVGFKTHQDALEDLVKIYESKNLETQKVQNFKENLDQFETKLKLVNADLEEKISLKDELNQKLLELSATSGEQKTLIERAAQIEALYKQRLELKNKLQKEKEVFEELAQAFGKNGIQAMIIESAIPELEDEANRLLDKLTEGRMKVTLETQKETKTKIQTAEGKIHTTVETLDIIISDEMGQRPYELYSGGEAFRVNFALRIALSKLLANRAGAKLQFLVIDEGFGSQDAPGRSRLVEVIDAIKDDFEKIVIITHLEELKEEFPVRIEVSKNSQGSTFEIIGA